MDFMAHSNLSVAIEGQSMVPASSVARRVVMSVLSSSDHFVSSGNPSAHIWALCPKNIFYQCDSAIESSVEQLLNVNGPMTINEVIAKADFPGASVGLLERILALRESGLNVLPGGRIWFIGIPVPARMGFDTVKESLEFALSLFPEGASIEDLRRVLCLSTENGVPITRISVSAGLSANPEVFAAVQRGKWTLVSNMVAEESPATGHVDTPDFEDEGEFNAEVFFGGAFAFAEE
jgi:hypothetical protein